MTVGGIARPKIGQFQTLSFWNESWQKTAEMSAPTRNLELGAAYKSRIGRGGRLNCFEQSLLLALAECT
jgi:hypothetical protein